MKIRFLYYRKTIAKIIFTFSLGMLTLVCGVGCSQNYGRIHWDETITQAFEANQSEPGYNYYQYTIGMRVFAIVGLDPKLELQSRIWRELETDTEDFKVAVSRIWYENGWTPDYARGAVIMDPDGEKAGVYFSSIPIVSIKFKPENQVVVMLDTTLIRGGPDGNGAMLD
ncbi:MAG: hypothetical protein PVF78_07580 [Desulfobacterales bacterium]|jgi:hypothetical protein